MKSRRVSYQVNEVYLMAVGEIPQPFGIQGILIPYFLCYYHSIRNF